jgi:membrane protein implicated in regulation of membrane protease activity
LAKPPDSGAQGVDRRGHDLRGIEVEDSHRTVGKYILFQLPELSVVCVLAIGARSWVGLPDWAAAGIIALWVIKDVVMFPFVRIAYQPGSRGGAASLLGASGTAQDALKPSGYVRISSELWRAELRPESPAVEPGDRVRVVGVHGLTLIVEAHDGREEPAERTRQTP